LDGERQYFYISQKWYEEFDRVIRGQVVDQAGYYHLATDVLLANRNVNRLLHECQMAQGLYDNFEMSAKVLAALNMAGQRERAGQIKAQLGAAVYDSKFRQNYDRAVNIWQNSGSSM
ncbi:MAG: hypothetical protein JRJ73_11775, partial [Deltaproteobacteria bacterium]|nr:hypothetical protein [Deltaproteobacteria bacterium]